MPNDLSPEGIKRQSIPRTAACAALEDYPSSNTPISASLLNTSPLSTFPRWHVYGVGVWPDYNAINCPKFKRKWYHGFGRLY